MDTGLIEGSYTTRQRSFLNYLEAIGDFKDCVVPTWWRISDKEQTDLKKGPAIPQDAKWKFSS